MSASFKRALGLALYVALAISGLPSAQAQHRHSHASEPSMGSMGDAQVDPAPPLMLHAGLHLEAGRAQAFGAERDYQGVALMLGARRGRFELGFHLPIYRIELGSAVGTGLGDMHLMGHWIAWAQGNSEIGLSAGGMPPFGNDDKGIGMGHAMVMGGGFARTRIGRYSAGLRLGYGTSFGSGGHAEHGVLVWPAVSPMNAQEIRSRAHVAVDLSHHIGASFSGLGAVPVGEGAFIAMLGGELTYALGRYTLGVGARHGLANHTAGLVLSSSLMSAF